MSTEFTRVIEIEELFTEYESNPELCRLLESGRYVYAEKRLVLNTPKYVTTVDGEYCLTDYAWDNIQECALSFEVIHQNTAISTETAAFAPPEIKTKKRLDTKGINEKTIDLNAVFERNEELRKAFYPLATLNMNGWDMMDKFIEAFGISSVDFQLDTPLSHRYFVRAKSEKDRVGQPKKVAIISFAMAYLLPRDMADRFLVSAGRGALSEASDEDRCYIFVLDALMLNSMEAKIDWLLSKGLPRESRNFFERLRG